ncbi:hypothetical protein [Lacrimispora sp.]|uniref:hypothetical protein n=1 Tax=Lacrimispora sp. TaxID=2719234 RepID=UPI00286D758A|nr:hypothetical protein [Lacrimispora sp.]
MINKKNISKIVISCIILLFVLAGIMHYNAMDSQLEQKSILIEMVLKDDSSDNIISIKTTDKNVELYFDITVMSDKLIDHKNVKSDHLHIILL